MSAGNALAAPQITAAVYDWSSGQLIITGTEFVSAAGSDNDVDASMLSISGEGGSYQLNDTPDVDIASDTGATLTLSATDRLHVHGLLNRDGTTSASATYNLEAPDGWMPGSPEDESDLAGNAITVSNVSAPAISSAIYDPDTGIVTVTAANLFHAPGVFNDVDISRFTFTGGMAQNYTLTSTSDVEISSATELSFTLSGADKTNVDSLLDQVGTSSSSATTYNIAGADGWLAGADDAVDISDLTGNGVTVVLFPTVTSASYDPATGMLVVSGTNIQANAGGADIDASQFTLTGEGAASHTLTDTLDVERDSITQFTLTLSTSDRGAVNALLNKAGSSSVDGTSYNLAVADDWNTAVSTGDSSDTGGNGISVANTPPLISNLNGDNVTFSIGGSGVSLDFAGDATLSDLTSSDFNGGSVTVSIVANHMISEDQLRIGNLGSISVSGTDVVHGGTTIGTYTGGSGGFNLVITLNTNATLARVQDLLRSIQYLNTDSATVNVAARTARITISDGDGGSDTSANQDITINLVSVPIIDLDADDSSGNTSGGYNGSFTENGGAVALADSDSSISDDGSFKALSVTLTSRPNGALEQLSSSIGSGAQTVNGEAVTIGVYNGATGNLTITIDDASATADTLQTLIESIRYDNGSEAPVTSDRTIAFSATDNEDNVGNAASAILTVNGVNDPLIGGVTILGGSHPPVVGETLTAGTSGISDADGLGSFSYQWLRGGLPITAGGTAASYLLTGADVGSTLSMTARYVDAGGTLESSTSVATAVVDGDLDGDGIGDSSDADIDGDGMSNDYEDANGLDKWDASDRDTDLDGDGISNYDESVAGSNANSDDHPPLVTPPADITVNATGLFTAVDPGAASAVDNLDGVLTPTSDAVGHYPPGISLVTWSATDAAGNTGTAIQAINVIPLAGLSKDQVSAEGSRVHFSILLNGDAVSYPVSLPYSVSGSAATDGSDHNLVDGVATINSGSREAVVSFSTVDDGAGEGTEQILVTLGTPTNAALGPHASQVIELVEGNVAPSVTLAVDQGSGSTRTVVSSGVGSVVVSASVSDPNPGDLHSYDWSASDNALIDIDGVEHSFTFDPLGLSPGFYTLHLTVSDSNGGSGEAQMILMLVANAPVLTTADSDGDGTDDATEGYGDSEVDGIPDYLDAVDSANVLQGMSGEHRRYLIETEPGLRLSLGQIAFRAGRGQAGVSMAEITAGGGIADNSVSYGYPGGVYDFSVAGLSQAGQSVKVVLPQQVAIPANAVYRKLIASQWQEFIENDSNSVASAPGAAGYCPPPGDAAYRIGLTEGYWCVQLTIEDGGLNDSDDKADKRIEDPGGITVVANSSYGSGGGGNISLLVLVLIGLVPVLRTYNWISTGLSH